MSAHPSGFGLMGFQARTVRAADGATVIVAADGQMRPALRRVVLSSTADANVLVQTTIGAAAPVTLFQVFLVAAGAGTLDLAGLRLIGPAGASLSVTVTGAAAWAYIEAYHE